MVDDALQEVIPTRGEAVNQFALFQAEATMLDIARDNQTIALLQLVGFAIAEKPEATAGNIGGLNMGMAVQLAFGVLFKTKRNDHQFGRFREYGSLDTLIRGHRREGGKLHIHSPL